MTKEEAYSVWMAAVESGSDTAHIYRSWYNFNDWWRTRSAKPEEATQTTTTGDGIPYEYKFNWSGYLNDGTNQRVQHSGGTEQRLCGPKNPKS